MEAMLKLVLFFVVSAPILWVSWRPLRDRRSHGFFRFFAFEALLVLVLLQVPRWFLDPVCARQIASWVLLLVSLLLAILGFRLLRSIGRPDGGIERTTVLVTVGVYKYIRHPLYASLLYGAWGVFLKDPSLLAGGLTVATCVFAFLTARAEESEMLAKFGSEYATYTKRTARFVPFVF